MPNKCQNKYQGQNNDTYLSPVVQCSTLIHFMKMFQVHILALTAMNKSRFIYDNLDMEASCCAWDILHANVIRGIMNGEEEREHYKATTLQ